MITGRIEHRTESARLRDTAGAVSMPGAWAGAKSNLAPYISPSHVLRISLTHFPSFCLRRRTGLNTVGIEQAAPSLRTIEPGDMLTSEYINIEAAASPSRTLPCLPQQASTAQSCIVYRTEGRGSTQQHPWFMMPKCYSLLVEQHAAARARSSPSKTLATESF